MQRIGLLNGENITYDKDITASTLASLTPGVISGLGITGTGASASIDAGKALVSVARTNGDAVMVYYESTASVPINMTGTKKVYIEVTQSAIDDGTTNAENGVGIAEIKTGTDYPSANYLPLYSVLSGVVTDERPQVRSKVMRQGLPTSSLSYADASGTERTVALGTAGQYATPDGTGGMVFADIPAVSIGTMPSLTTVASTDETLVRHSGVEYKSTIQNAIRGNYETYTAGEAISARMPVSYYGVTDANGTPASHNGSNTQKVAIRLDAYRTLIVYVNAGGTMATRVVKRGSAISDTTITYGTEYTISGYNGLTWYISACLLSTDTVVVTFSSLSGYTYCPSHVLTVSDTVVTVGTATNGPSGTTYLYTEQTVSRLSSTQALVIAYNQNQSRVESWILSISGTTINNGTIYNLFTSVSLARMSAENINTNKVILMRGSSYSVVSVSGSVVSVGTEVSGPSGTMTGVCIRSLSTDKAVAIGSYTGNVYGQVVYVSGTTVTIGSAVTISTSTLTQWLVQCTIERPDKVWFGHDTLLTPATISGNTITLGTTQSVLASMPAFLSCSDRVMGKSMIMGSATSYLMKSLPVSYGYNMATVGSVEASKCIGFARSTVSAGDTTLSLEHSQAITGFSGLTPGADYYLQDAGGIGLAPGSVPKIVGRAVSSTTLIPIIT